jgi:hypothetical protein
MDKYEEIKNKTKQSATLLDLRQNTKLSLTVQNEQDKATHQQVKTSLQEKKSQREACIFKIAEMENNAEQVKIGDIQHTIPPTTRTREIEEAIPGKFNMVDSGNFRPVTTYPQKLVGYEQKVVATSSYGPKRVVGRKLSKEYDDFANQRRAEGYVLIETTVGHRKTCAATKYGDNIDKPIYVTERVDSQEAIQIQVPVMGKRTITEAIPYGNTSEYPILFPSSLPVSINLAQGNAGWTIKPGSERKESGYSAAIVYEIGQGCTVNVEVKVDKKFTQEGKAALQAQIETKNHLDREIITLSQQERDLDFQIQRNNAALEMMSGECTSVEQQTQKLEDDLEDYSAFLSDKQHDFESLRQLQAILLQSETPVVNNQEARVSLASHSSTLFGSNQNIYQTDAPTLSGLGMQNR